MKIIVDRYKIYKIKNKNNDENLSNIDLDFYIKNSSDTRKLIETLVGKLYNSVDYIIQARFVQKNARNFQFENENILKQLIENGLKKLGIEEKFNVIKIINYPIVFDNNYGILNFNYFEGKTQNSEIFINGIVIEQTIEPLLNIGLSNYSICCNISNIESSKLSNKVEEMTTEILVLRDLLFFYALKAL